MSLAVSIAVPTALVVFLLVRYAGFPGLWKAPTEPDPDQDTCREGGCHLRNSEHSPSGVVRVIRLTDDGEFADRCELTDVIYEIRNCQAPELGAGGHAG